MKAEDFLDYIKLKRSIVESIPHLQKVGVLTPLGLKTRKNIPDGTKLYNELGKIIGTYNSLGRFNIDWENKDLVNNGDTLFIEKNVRTPTLEYQFETRFQSLVKRLSEDATGGATGAGAVAVSVIPLFKKKKAIKRK
ncbi:MAG: hypothetical protein N2235_03090 [Fischerella sp.]|nr:hypothetical protein [Fischerella sp.]